MGVNAGAGVMDMGEDNDRCKLEHASLLIDAIDGIVDKMSIDMDMFLLTCRHPIPCGPLMDNDSPQNVAIHISYKLGDCSCRLLDSSPPKEKDMGSCGT